MNRKIAVLKEVRVGESRVILLPREVRQLTDSGYEVLVEIDAGKACGLEDDAYSSAGATIVNMETAWSQSDLIVKYKAYA